MGRERTLAGVSPLVSLVRGRRVFLSAQTDPASLSVSHDAEFAVGVCGELVVVSLCGFT